MNQALTVSALSSDLRRVRTPEGSVLAVPDGWALLPPGDPGLTRRVKTVGPSWTVVEKKGQKVFSKGVWAPASRIEEARNELAVERAMPGYAKRLEAAARRRGVAQAAYVEDFETEVRRRTEAVREVRGSADRPRRGPSPPRKTSNDAAAVLAHPVLCSRS